MINYDGFKLTEEQINKLPPLSLDSLNEDVDAYTLKDFDYDKSKLPCVILLLPDDESKSGHYIALCQSLDKKILYYCDSYGYNPLNLWELHPSMLGEKQDIDKWGEFLKSYDKIIYQDKKLQNDNSNLCGYYCLTYIYEFLSRKDFTPEIFAQVLRYIKKKLDLDSYDNALIIYFKCVVQGLTNIYNEYKQLKEKDDENKPADK